MADRPKVPRNVNLAALDNPNIAFDFKTAESPEERASRLRREEAEDAHKRRISLIVHVFVMTIVALAFCASVYILVTQETRRRTSRTRRLASSRPSWRPCWDI